MDEWKNSDKCSVRDTLEIVGDNDVKFFPNTRYFNHIREPLAAHHENFIVLYNPISALFIL